MKLTHKWQDIALSICLILAVGSVIVATAVYVKQGKPQTPKDQARTYQAERVKDLPHVFSKIRGLEISGVTLEKQGTPEAALLINVTNNRDEAVVALDFIAGRRDYSGLRLDGLSEEGQQRIIIPPHSLETFTWNLGAILDGEDVYVAAAVFADGKEEGEKRSLDGLRVTRQKDQRQQREAKLKKGVNQ